MVSTSGMKKLTALIQGSETTVDLQDTVLTTGNEYVFVKKASIFWEYLNITEDISPAISTVKHGKTSLTRGYWTFNDIAKVFLEHEVTLERRKDGKCNLVNTGTGDLYLAKVLYKLLGFDVPHLFNPRSHTSDTKSDINLGLRYINVSCNLVDTNCNYSTNGRKSGVIMALPITTSQSLFGSVTSYIDTESKVPVIKGAFGEVKFTVTDQDGNPVDIGQVLVELYIM